MFRFDLFNNQKTIREQCRTYLQHQPSLFVSAEFEYMSGMESL